MKFSQELPDNKFFIQRYEKGSVTVDNQTYTNSLIITPKAIFAQWRPQTFNDLQAKDLTYIVELKPQIVLLGTGSQQQFPHPSILAELYNNNIGVEIMDTGAACRTFNLLLSEHRNVIAALIIN